MNKHHQIQLNNTQLLQSKSTVKARTVSSSGLFEGQMELLIEHGEDVYRLRQTSQGKLILTK